jgi:hypothetical protein
MVDRFALLRESRATMMRVREEARAHAVRAIRAIESELVDALDGATLRGLPNLGGNGERFYAIRVRTQRDAEVGPNAEEPIGGDEESLCLTKEGVLVVVGWLRARDTQLADRIYSPPVRDENLLLEDVEALVRTVHYVVPRHLAQLEQTSARFSRIGELAARICAELTQEKPPGTRVPETD